jgi:hypothetical protein
MSKEAKKKIQELAWTRFPAQELWIDSNDHFWGYEKKEDGVHLVDGFYQDGEVISDITICRVDCPEEYIEKCIKHKQDQGYECFASQLFL